jgi:hypothetical protein
MRRFRLSSLLFLIAIAGLLCALFIQQRRAAEREQQLMEEIRRLRYQQIYLRLIEEADLLLEQQMGKGAPAGESAADKANEWERTSDSN